MEKNLTRHDEAVPPAAVSVTGSESVASPVHPIAAAEASAQGAAITGNTPARAAEDDIEYPRPLDVVAAVRAYVPPEGERGSLSISGCPKYMACAVEDLGRRASASQAKTFAALLDIGIERLWRFPGARDLQRAREAIMAHADPAAVRWIDTWDFDVPTADTGECVKKLRLSVIGVLTPLGNLAKVLGVGMSKTAALALAAVLLEDAAVPDRYHRALGALLRGFAAKLEDRVASAEEYVAKGSNANGGSSAPRHTLLDIIGARR